MKYRLITIFFILHLCIKSSAQEVITTSGNDLTAVDGTINYTVGQIVYTTNIQNESIIQGVQQPFEIQVVLGIENTGINLEIIVFPNPTKNYLTLKLFEIDFTNLKYEMYDLQSKLLIKENIFDNDNIISLKNLPSSTYFLEVSTNQKILKTFKIIKR